MIVFIAEQCGFSNIIFSVKINDNNESTEDIYQDGGNDL